MGNKAAGSIGLQHSERVVRALKLWVQISPGVMTPRKRAAIRELEALFATLTKRELVAYHAGAERRRKAGFK